MNDCLWCNQAIIYQPSWRHLVTFVERTTLCDDCQSELELLNGKRCVKCSRKSDMEQCLDCKYWSEKLGKDPLTANISVYSYNERMREMIAKWKYRGDYELVYAFRPMFVKVFKNHFLTQLKNFIIVPIPLSEMRLHER